AADVPGVYLYDIDDLRRMVARDQDARREAVERAGAMSSELAADAWARITRPVPAGVPAA
ncbi:MAG: hypothetical protein KGL53_06935, partial [Elusimicrobia bacterium]|nr:hypothetical protein [Elusimicrobiota bacterium]